MFGLAYWVNWVTTISTKPAFMVYIVFTTDIPHTVISTMQMLCAIIFLVVSKSEAWSTFLRAYVISKHMCSRSIVEHVAHWSCWLILSNKSEASLISTLTNSWSGTSSESSSGKVSTLLPAGSR